jgi:hypothetical protein
MASKASKPTVLAYLDKYSGPLFIYLGNYDCLALHRLAGCVLQNA